VRASSDCSLRSGSVFSEGVDVEPWWLYNWLEHVALHDLKDYLFEDFELLNGLEFENADECNERDEYDATEYYKEPWRWESLFFSWIFKYCNNTCNQPIASFIWWVLE
jgi:hypothetical protein